MASKKLRVLVSGDIASEGVNLHKQCHHLIHVDLPWSLITLEQRNGRIDRYGQEHSPEIHYLVYQPDDEEIASDMRVISKLIAKEHAAHRALGDVGSVMGLYSETDEEAQVRKALQERTAHEREQALEESAPEPEEFDLWAFAGLDSNESTETEQPPPQVPAAPVRSLFSGDDDYLSAAVDLAYGNPAIEISWETSGQVVSFQPPEDLVRRLGTLPQSYLKQRKLHERLHLTSHAATADQSLKDAVNQRADAGETGTAWPEIHHLGPQHPVLEWIADKILYRLDRDEAIALPCDVDEPTLLVSGVWSNKQGEPIAAAWLAATVEDDLVSFAEMHEALEAAGVRDGMVNPEWSGDPKDLRGLIPSVVAAAESKLTDELLDQLTPIEERLNLVKTRLESWGHEARSVADGMSSDVHKRRRLEVIKSRTEQMDRLLDDHTPADTPLVRIVGALVPKGAR